MLNSSNFDKSGNSQRLYKVSNQLGWTPQQRVDFMLKYDNLPKELLTKAIRTLEIKHGL